jgi:hypothetical protein
MFHFVRKMEVGLIFPDASNTRQAFKSKLEAFVQAYQAIALMVS